MQIPLISEKMIGRLGFAVFGALTVWVVMEVVTLDKDVMLLKDQTSTNAAQWRAIASISKDIMSVQITAGVNNELLKLLVLPESTTAEQVVESAAPAPVAAIHLPPPPPKIVPPVPVPVPVQKDFPPASATQESEKNPIPATAQAARYFRLAEQVKSMDTANTPDAVRQRWEEK